MEPIIQSLLDTDFYKFNMNQVIFHNHTDATGTYYFQCRNKDVIFTEEMVEEINRQIDHLCTLSFTKDELDYLKSIRFLKSDYVEFLRLWHPIRDYVTVSLEDGKLSCVVQAPMFSGMQFEIYLLSIINEVYFYYQNRAEGAYTALLRSAKEHLDDTAEKIKNGTYRFPAFAEFGTRRRLSRAWQEEVVKEFLTLPKDNCRMVGTSNVYLAKKYGLTPVGTYAHEFVQMYQGFPNIPLAYTNHYAMKDWFREYNGDNGTALTDTLTTDLFLLDFDYLNARCYTGVRHDSGDPFEWGEKILRHYEKLGIYTQSKTLMFSDNLNFTKCTELYEHFHERCNVAFGVGTWLTNNTSQTPLNSVIKLQYVNGRPVAKLSDTPGKTMCQDPAYEHYLRQSVSFRLEHP